MRLIDRDPYSDRDEVQLLLELNELSEHHIQGCPAFAKIWPNFKEAKSITEVPFLHVGIFKYLNLKTEKNWLNHGRLLNSSATSGIPSQIILDEHSSKLQSQSSQKILSNLVGQEKRPLLILDCSRSLRSPTVSARVAAAMSLKPMASDIVFLIDDMNSPADLKWNLLSMQLENNENLLIYGFTWVLWQSFANNKIPNSIKKQMEGKTIHFVHSGGWKKLENLKVSHEKFNSLLLEGLSEKSKVIDYYGLVEQVGIIYPLDDEGYRTIPIWADCIIRDPLTLAPLFDTPGQIQLLNTLAFGAPYYSVLTEDMGIMRKSDFGRPIKKFKLIGRMPKAEVRGCANV